MYFFNAAQPALLYLVPACLGGSLLVGAYRGELSVLFAYDEEDKSSKGEKKEEKGNTTSSSTAAALKKAE